MTWDEREDSKGRLGKRLLLLVQAKNNDVLDQIGKHRSDKKNSDSDKDF